MLTVLPRTRRGTYLMTITHWFGFLSVIFCIMGSTSAQSYSRAFELQAVAPQFWNLVERNAKLDVVATGLGFTEGPMWDPAGFLTSATRPSTRFSEFFRMGKRKQ